MPRYLPPLLTFILGGIIAIQLFPSEQADVIDQLAGFPDSDFFTQALRPWIVVFLSFMPFIAALAYSLGSTFDRYITRQFLSIFFISLSALAGIWLLIDLGENISDFKGVENRFLTIIAYYSQWSPAILMVILPYALLLALINGLGKLSKSNEIIAMIQSGTGVIRVSVPLIFAGFWSATFLICLNYHWAPGAENKRDELLARAKGQPIYQATNVLYRNPGSPRLWLVGAFPEDYQKNGRIEKVEVTTIRADGTIESRLSSERAHWGRNSREWTFEKPLIAHFFVGKSPRIEQLDQDLVFKNWRETPQQIIKPGLSVENLGIPEISTWLASPLAQQTLSNKVSYLTHWHYRWSLPFTCVVTVLLAAPLSIHFTRRGNSSGIFLAVALSVAMIFVSSVSLTFGEANLLSPMLAAWLPNLCFGLAGLWLYQRRVSGLPIYQSLKQLINSNS
jgi:lipopolysaccharide export system permease protein